VTSDVIPSFISESGFGTEISILKVLVSGLADEEMNLTFQIQNVELINH